MDKDTAIKYLKEKYRKEYLREDGTWKSESARIMQDDCDKIADFIEQQAQCAELGRLAVNLHGYICTIEGFGKWKECIDDCQYISFCQKRAELKEDNLRRSDYGFWSKDSVV